MYLIFRGRPSEGTDKLALHATKDLESNICNICPVKVCEVRSCLNHTSSAPDSYYAHGADARGRDLRDVRDVRPASLARARGPDANGHPASEPNRGSSARVGGHAEVLRWSEPREIRTHFELISNRCCDLLLWYPLVLVQIKAHAGTPPLAVLVYLVTCRRHDDSSIHGRICVLWVCGHSQEETY